MGYQYTFNVAGANLSALSPTAFRILVRMAVSVMDSDSLETGRMEGVYYDGRNALGYVLGAGLWDQFDAMPESVDRRIRRGIAELLDAGYLETVPPAMQSQWPVTLYRLNLTPALDKVTDQYRDNPLR
jgi:hypothetical protein